MAASDPNELNVVRRLGLIAAVSIVIGHMIGQGVFLKARVMTCNVETPGMVMVVWLVTGLLTLAGALTLAELATMMPKAGGIYIYLREAYGPVWGFLYGWMDVVVGTVSIATAGVVFAIFLNVVTGGMFTAEISAINIAGSSISLGTPQVISVSIIGIVMIVNCASVAVGGRVAAVLAIFKVALVMGIGVAAFTLVDVNWSNFALSGASGTCEGVAESARGGPAGFAAAMLGALAAYGGWQSILYLAGEVKHPSRNIPAALIGGVLTVTLLYLFVNAGYFAVLTPLEVASVSTNSSVATAAVAKFIGPISSKVIAAAILISVLGLLQVASMRLARSLFAMSRDGMFFPSLGEVSPTTRVPVKAILVQGLWAMVIVFFGSYDTLSDYQNFVLSIFFGLAGASVFVLRRKMPDAERPYRTLGYPVVPVLFLLVTAWLIVNTIVTSPVRSLTGIALIAAGLPIYWYRERRGEITSEASDTE